MRRRQISFKQIQMAAEEADEKEKSLENPMFSIKTLRQPYHKLD